LLRPPLRGIAQSIPNPSTERFTTRSSKITTDDALATGNRRCRDRDRIRDTLSRERRSLGKPGGDILCRPEHRDANLEESFVRKICFLAALIAMAVAVSGCDVAFIMAQSAHKHRDSGHFRNSINDMLEVAARDPQHATFYGHLPHELESYSGQDGFDPDARHEQVASVRLKFEKLEDGRICIQQKRREDVFGFDAGEKKRVDGILRSWKFHVDAVGSLDEPDVRHREIWPKDMSDNLDVVEMVRFDKGSRSATEVAKGKREKYVDAVYRHCGKAPAIAPETRFLTVEVKCNQGVDTADPYVIFWKLDPPEAPAASDPAP
jgi:hypothetical protein